MDLRRGVIWTVLYFAFISLLPKQIYTLKSRHQVLIVQVLDGFCKHGLNRESVEEDMNSSLQKNICPSLRPYSNSSLIILSRCLSITYQLALLVRL